MRLLFLRILFTRFWLTFRAHPLVAVGSLTIAAGLFTVLRGAWRDQGTADTVAAAVVAAWSLPFAVAWLTAAASVGETSPTLPAMGAAAGLGVGVALAHATLATVVAIVAVLPSVGEDGMLVVVAGPVTAFFAIPMILVSMLVIVPPVLLSARAAHARNLDLRDGRAFLGAALLALVNVLLGGAYVGFVRNSAPSALHPVVAVPLLVALGAALAVAGSALRRRRARAHLAVTCPHVPLDDAARAALADAPFFGPGDHPTHARDADEAVGYRTPASAPVGYFAQRKVG